MLGPRPPRPGRDPCRPPGRPLEEGTDPGEPHVALSLEVVGDDRGARVGDPADGGGDLVRRAIVQEQAPARDEAATGEQDGDLGLAVRHGVGDELDGRPCGPAVRALDDVEGEAGERDAAPLLLQVSRRLAVQVEVDDPELVGQEGPGVLDGPRGRKVQRVDEDDHHVAPQERGLAGLHGTDLELRVLAGVLPVEAEEHQDSEREDHDDRPRAFGEFRDDDDDVDDEREHAGPAVDPRSPAPAGFPIAQVEPEHARPAMVNPVKTPIA